MSAILGVIQNYSAKAWASPQAFRNLIAKPMDLIGKWCEFQGLENHFGTGLLFRDMTRFKVMIGALAHLKNPSELLCLGMPKSKNPAERISRMSLAFFKQWEILTYLKEIQFLHFPKKYETYLGWQGTVSGSICCLSKLKAEWSKSEKDFSWVRVALNGSALALSLLYNPMLDAKNDYKLAKLVATTVMVGTGAINAYWTDPNTAEIKTA